MRPSRWFPAIGAVAIGVIASIGVARPALAGPSATHDNVLRIQVTGNGGTTEGTCTLVGVERRAGDVAEYFLTAAHLFSPVMVGDQATAALRVRLTFADGSTIETSGSRVLFPSGVEAGVDVAVVKVTSPAAHGSAATVVFDPPEVGGLFTVHGPNTTLLRVSTERVRFHSMRLVVGDRALLDVTGMIGAPAMTENGVFGIVSTVGGHRIPVVTLLSGAREFLARAIPSMAPQPLARPTFHMQEMTQPHEATEEGARRPNELRLGSLTVPWIGHRNVMLRFAMVGRPPASSPLPFMRATPLFTIDTDLVLVAKR